MSAIVSNRSPISHGLRRQAIIESLLSDVMHGRLRPGQHLVTQELAERYGTSHTPIREALIALEGVGMIDLLPNRGATVRRVTTQDIREICQVRRVLECEAVRSACGRIELAQLQALREAFGKLNASGSHSLSTFIQEARDCDSQLHDLIAASCDNQILAGELNRLKLLFRACRDVAWEHDESRNDYRRLAEEAREHLAIIDALLACDARAASRAMSAHIRSGMNYWSRAVPASADAKAAVSTSKSSKSQSAPAAEGYPSARPRIN